MIHWSRHARAGLFALSGLAGLFTLSGLGLGLSLGLGLGLSLGLRLRPGLRPGLPLGLLLSLLLTSCATYSERLLDTRSALDLGDYAGATAELDRLVGSEFTEALPEKQNRDAPLALLERGVLLQTQGRYGLSARDWTAADEGLEWLDMSTDALGTIGEYIYSDSAGIYRAPPSERLAQAGLNALNYLSRGDLSGSAVEARRYTVMRVYLDSREVEYGGALGAYLAALTFEKQGMGDRALRYYDEALAGGSSVESVAESVVRLAARFPYRTPRLRKLLSGRGASGSSADSGSEIIVVLATGRVPYRVPERIPVGAAVGIAGAFFTGDARVLSRGVAKVVVYPELAQGRSGDTIRSVSVDGGPIAAHTIDDLAAQVTREYSEVKPRIIAAALSRMLVRAGVAEGVRVATNAKSSGLGELAAVLVEGALVALDKPDTRSWTLMPARVAVARARVQPGTHSVAVELSGESRSFDVEVPASGFVVVVVTSPR